MSSSRNVEHHVPEGQSLEVIAPEQLIVTGHPEITGVSTLRIEGPSTVTFARTEGREVRLTLIMAGLYWMFLALEKVSISFYVRNFLVRRVSRWASAQFMDCYVLSRLIIELTTFSYASRLLLVTILIISLYRLVELTQAYANVLVFHRIRHDPSLGPYRIVSHWRTFVIGVINMLEGAFLFGLLHYVSASFGNITPKISSSWDALYFSLATLTTLGYGDVLPVHFGRAIAAAEAIWGVLFGIALLGRFVAGLPSDRALDNSGK